MFHFQPSSNAVSFVLVFVSQVDDFLQALMSYDKEHIPESCLTVVKQEYLRNPDFHPDLVWTKSTAAAGLCAWTINIVRYYEVSHCIQINSKTVFPMRNLILHFKVFFSDMLYLFFIYFCRSIVR